MVNGKVVIIKGISKEPVESCFKTVYDFSKTHLLADGGPQANTTNGKCRPIDGNKPNETVSE